MESSAFSRVKSLLKYARPAQWTAILSGMATALLYAMLVLILALFVDLLVTRGRIPGVAQLPAREQEAVARDWSALPDEDRARAFEHICQRESDRPRLANPEEERWAVVFDQAITVEAGAALLGDTTMAPPVPSAMTPENLQAWAARRKLSGGDAYYRAMQINELRWRMYVWHYLNRHVGPDAADRWAEDTGVSTLTLARLEQEPRRTYGSLGLVVRQRNTPWARVTSTFASLAGWTWRAADPNRGYMTGLLVLGLGLVLLRGICMVVMNDAAARASLEVVTRLRRSIYHHTARQGAMTINAGAVDEAGQLFTRQVEHVHEALHYSLTHSYRYALFFPLMLLIALFAHFWLALACLMFAALVWAVAGQMTSSFRRRARAATRVATNRLELLLESLRHMRLVKSYLMELFNQSRVERQLADYATAQTRRSRGDAFAKPLLTAFAVMAGLALLYLAGWVVLNEGLSVAGVVVLAVAFLSLYFPVRARLAGRRTMRHGREAAAAIFEFLDRKGDVATYPDAEFLPGIHRGIEFADVTVREPETGRLLLNKASFKVRAGQRVGIVGSDVEEQLALVSLIPRFLDPAEGEVKIDGRSVKWVTQDSLRAQIGLVLQNSLVFNDTVSNNIGCGDPSFTLPQIIEAAKLAHAHQFVQRLPHGYETPIGELGRSLSPGEQFRIALARAVLRDPSLYVIEELSDLDDDTKDLVDDTLNRVLPGKTVIYLPHRVSTLRSCDKILLLHEGRVVAAGEHRDLMADNELYRHLYYLEFNPYADAVAG
jgi:ATP-binding cassette, subfamily B, bacterial